MSSEDLEDLGTTFDLIRGDEKREEEMWWSDDVMWDVLYE